ncbi:hypothetical protein K504DRAFT_448694 [Pleomassaria siparia CBS 279.74]|uniref:Carboxylesterase type B domain-containing protein n=1 Tax=Pleomassaria siparia CBS 279.74 TaxID=1314801 RepID=A0A6G1JYU0_9PLEO|nr:hypothetical protein K504DRAFT_448694 [Pleomassaria siparia CBS 279.74]
MPTLIGMAFVAFFACLDSTVGPGPSSIGSDLTILTHNYLYTESAYLQRQAELVPLSCHLGTASPRQVALIVLRTSQSFKTTDTGCATIRETLWSPRNNATRLDFLRYLDYGAADELGLCWFGGTGCRATATEGKIQTVSCNARLPTLCAQSVPMSSPSTSDIAPKRQIAIKLSRKKTAMLWLHGGGLTVETGSHATFESGNMASRGDVVAVAINYCRSTFGFFALDNVTLRGKMGWMIE